MSIIKTLEKLGQDPSQTSSALTQKQLQEIATLKAHAAFVNANMMIDEPDKPDDEPDPNKEPDI